MSVEREDPLAGLRRAVLLDVSFTVRPGEAVALVGQNGAGKSTALLAAAGLVPLAAGRVRLEGVDVRDAARRSPRRLRARIGVALQFPERSFFQASVREEIAFTPKSLGRSPGEVRRGVERALALSGLSPALLDRSPFSLSGGEKRRVALACAAAHEPALLLLDEPEAGLDREGMASVRSFITQFTAAGGALVAAIHDVAWALSWASRCLVLRDGRVQADVDVERPSAEAGEALGGWLPDGGALLRLMARAAERGVPLPSPYREEAAFLAFVEERLAERFGGAAP